MAEGGKAEETEARPTCRVCGQSIEPGDNVVFTTVFGDVETVHLRCDPQARRSSRGVHP
jgi:hypothetical protein